MKNLLFTFFALLIFCLPTLAQDLLPSNFTFKKDESGVYQLLPDEEKILSEVNDGKAYQSLGIIAQPEQDNYGLVFVNAYDENSDKSAEDQIGKPFVITLEESSDNKLYGAAVKVVSRKKVKKFYIEVLSVRLPKSDFEKLLGSENISVVYGDINYDVSPENIRAFQYLKSEIDNNSARKRLPTSSPSPTNNSGEVQVKGYYRKDGTYVRPHTRNTPKRKN